MTFKLHLKRTYMQARTFERRALDDIWIAPEVGGFYAPEARDSSRVQAMVLQSDDRAASEQTVSVFFLLSSEERKFVEIAIKRTASSEFTYGGWILVPSGIALLDGRIEQASMNGHRIISTAGEGTRVNYGYDGSRYRELMIAAAGSMRRVQRRSD